MSKDLFDMKCSIHKVQCVFKTQDRVEEVENELNLLKKEQRGSLYTYTARGTCEEITAIIQKRNPIFVEVLPLSLEEIFISETEVVGYDIKKLIM